MSVTVRIPGPLRRHTGGQGKLTAQPGRLADVLATAGTEHLALQERLFTADGSLRPEVRVFVAETDIRSLDGLDTVVAAGQTVSLVLPVAGA